MIEVKFENPPGNVLSTRQFEPGQALRIGVHVTHWSSPVIYLPVRFEFYNGASYFEDRSTDIWANAWVDWIMPNVVTKATVKITAYHILGPETMEIPIGIGREPPPVGGAINWTLLWVIGGIGVGLAALYVFTRASGIHKVTSATASRIKGSGQSIQRKLAATAKA